MNDILGLALACLAGLALGAIFFGGLWWTVRKGIASPQPAFWFLASMLLRMILALVGFYFVGLGNWERLVACLIGFVIARFVFVFLARTPVGHHLPTAKETNHAP